MPRLGIEKEDVREALNRLLALGRRPSLDAIRIELGNTGSKTTISRLLREIEEEEGFRGPERKPISESLQALVGQLSDRVQEEADIRLAQQSLKHAEEKTQLEDQINGWKSETERLRAELAVTQQSLEAGRIQLQEVAEKLQQETIESNRLRQEAGELKSLLEQSRTREESLEEKHRHARESLEHFRELTRQQREQEQRQNEQQLQYLQSELRQNATLLTKKQTENLQLATERTSLSERLRQQEERASLLLINIQDLKTQLSGMEPVRAQLAEQKQQYGLLSSEYERFRETLKESKAQEEKLQLQLTQAQEKIREQELELVKTQTSTILVEQLLSELRNAKSPQEQDRA